MIGVLTRFVALDLSALLALRSYVHPVAAQPGGKTGILSFSSDRQRQLMVIDDHDRLFFVFIDPHFFDLGRAQGFSDELGRVFAPLDHVDLFCA